MNAENLVGNILSDRYEVIEKVGTGGMASVFKAKDTLLNRLVAIKVLKEDTNDENTSRSFIKEAQSAASLTHNNIVSVYDVGEENGLKYMVMELVDGITLKEYIKQTGTLEWQEACDFALQIGQGIGFAHTSNIIHRDIKPQNIIMTKDKTLKVTDFGIARAAAGDTTIVGGTALGSVHYISPEQARGGYTDERSDIYSLGIVLYEMLAGKVPFDGETPVTVALMHLEKDPVNVRCVNMDIPESLAYVTMKAIAKEPSKRYKNIEEFLDDIHAVLAEEPLPSMEGMEEEIYQEPAVYEDTYEDYFDEDEEEIYEEEKPKKKKKQKSAKQKKEDRNAVLLAFLTLIAIGLVAFGAYTLFGSTKGVKAPDLTNMTLQEAQAEIDSLEQNIEIGEILFTISDNIEKDKIVTQDPEPGKFVPKGGKINIVVSMGSSGGDVSVPNVEGDEFSVAITKIFDQGLTYKEVEEESETVPAGSIIRQLPVAGTKLNRDDTVTLYVSIGKGEETAQTSEPVRKVPVVDVVGYGKEEAENMIAEQGLHVTSVVEQYSDSLEGLVIKQSPSAAEIVDEGSGVSIVISKGPKPAEEPEPTPSQEPETPGNVPGNDPVESQNPSSGTAKKTRQFVLKIPDSADAEVEVQVFADGELIYSKVHDKTEEYVTVSVQGTSGNVSVQGMIDGSLAAQRTLNFD